MASSQLSLLDLPSELLETICSHLCHHCTEPTHPSRISWPTPGIMRDDIPSKRSLMDVSLTCQPLRAAAQPILLHSIIYRIDLEPGWDLTDYLSLLLRTLRCRKDLRAHVRYLDIDAQNTLCPCCPHFYSTPNHKVRKSIRNICAEIAFPLRHDSLDGRRVQETLMQLTLALLPNLSEIRLVVPRHWTFELLYTWRYMRAGLGEGSIGFLPTVRTMLLEMDELATDQCTSAHVRCQKPISPSPVEEILVDAVPNLRVLSCTAPGLNHLSSLPSLTHLQIWIRGAWDDDKMLSLIQGLPRLTHFAYWGNNQHGPTIRLVQQALAPLHESLECLSLSFAKRYQDTKSLFRHMANGKNRWEPLQQKDFILTSLKDFTRLKTLTIDDHMCWGDPEPTFTPTQATTDTNSGGGRFDRDLLDFLPASLEVFSVFNSAGTVLPVERLAQAMVNGSRPNLRKVLWAEANAEGFYYLMDRNESRIHDGTAWLQNDVWKKLLSREATVATYDRLYHPFTDWDDVEHDVQVSLDANQP